MIIKTMKTGTDKRGTTTGPGTKLTPQLAHALGLAFARYTADTLGKTPHETTLAIGHDGCEGAEESLAACASGMSDAGAAVQDFGLCTAPALRRTIVTAGYKPDGTAMISDSGNSRNGLRFFLPHGGLNGEQILSLVQRAEKGTHPADVPGKISHLSFLPVYEQFLTDLVLSKLETDIAKPLLGLHVIVDADGGAGGFYAAMLEKLGAWTDGSYNLLPGSAVTHGDFESDAALSPLGHKVREMGADLGIAFDTDCDRMALVDDMGRPITHNRLIALCSAMLLDEAASRTIVTDSVTSAGLTKFINAWNGEHYRYKRGYRNVIAEAIRLNESGIDCPLAIETSGHAAFRDNRFLDDGMYLATRLIIKAMELKQEGQRLVSLIADLQEGAESTALRLAITGSNFRQTGVNAIDMVLDHANSALDWHIAPDNREGVRIYCDMNGQMEAGWFMLRMFLREPILALNVESDLPGGTKAILSALYDVLKSASGIDLTPLEDKIASL